MRFPFHQYAENVLKYFPFFIFYIFNVECRRFAPNAPIRISLKFDYSIVVLSCFAFRDIHFIVTSVPGDPIGFL